MKLHVNSSLPRSGSELLQALLAQHPEIYASATSPLLEYWYGAMGNYNLAEVKSQDPKLMEKAFTGFLKSSAEGYYGSLTNEPVVVDKSRGWLQHAELLWRAFPDARIICMTRKVEDIVASLERIYQQHNGHPETRHLPRQAEERAKHWTTFGNLPLGLALARLVDRQRLGPDERIMYVDYDKLVSDPQTTMARVFTHIRLDPITVDTENIVKAVPEDDSHYGIFGQHQLRPRLEKCDARR